VIPARIGESVAQHLFICWRVFVFGVVCFVCVCVLCFVCVCVCANSDNELRNSAVTKNVLKTDRRADLRCLCIRIRLLFWCTVKVLLLFSTQFLSFIYKKHKLYSQLFLALCLIIDGFGGLVVSMLASGSRVRGFEAVGFFPM
jgi:hypothetical protein